MKCVWVGELERLWPVGEGSAAALEERVERGGDVPKADQTEEHGDRGDLPLGGARLRGEAEERVAVVELGGLGVRGGGGRRAVRGRGGGRAGGSGRW